MRFGFSGRSCGSVRDSWRFLDRAPPRVAAAGHGPSFSYGAEGNAADPPREKHHGTLVSPSGRAGPGWGDTWAARGEHHEHQIGACAMMLMMLTGRPQRWLPHCVAEQLLVIYFPGGFEAEMQGSGDGGGARAPPAPAPAPID